MQPDVAPQRDDKGQFIIGYKGGPGRPSGARNKLGEQFLKALQEDFETHGVQAIQTVREDKPDQYLKVIASLMPRDVNLNINEAERLTDEQIITRLRKLNEILGPVISAYGDGSAHQRAIAPPTH